MNQDQMPKINQSANQPKLARSDVIYMKRIEEENLIRVKQLMKNRRACNITATTLGLTAIGIYCYTIYTMKQERFLDDLNEPEKVYNESNAEKY